MTTREHYYSLKTGISRTPEFEKKGLATHAVNVGTKCGHGCLYHPQAQAIATIRNRAHWSHYVVDLISHIQRSVRRFHDIYKLRFLLYPGDLTPEDLVRVREDNAGVVWLGKKQITE